MGKASVFSFSPNLWSTPNTYGTNFKDVPNTPGVYLLVNAEFSNDLKSVNHTILYVGSSKCLRVRYKSHEVLRTLRSMHDYIQFYFIETKDYINTEKLLIKSIKPKYNKQWL